MSESEFAELAAGHSLGSLSAEDERRFEDALADHPEWAAIAEEDVETAALLAENAPAVAPPTEIRDTLLARIVTTPQEREPEPASPAAVSPPSAPETPRRRQRRLRFVLAACLALIVGLGVGAAIVIPQLRPADVVALDRVEGAPDAAQRTASVPSGGTVTAHWSVSAGEAVLVTDGLRRPDGDRTYELWFIRDRTPVSAGTFDPGQGTTTVALRGTLHAGDAIAVTVEQAGGSPTGAPTGDPVFVIPTS